MSYKMCHVNQFSIVYWMENVYRAFYIIENKILFYFFLKYEKYSGFAIVIAIEYVRACDKILIKWDENSYQKVEPRLRSAHRRYYFYECPGELALICIVPFPYTRGECKRKEISLERAVVASPWTGAPRCHVLHELTRALCCTAYSCMITEQAIGWSANPLKILSLRKTI